MYGELLVDLIIHADSVASVLHSSSNVRSRAYSLSPPLKFDTWIDEAISVLQAVTSTCLDFLPRTFKANRAVRT